MGCPTLVNERYRRKLASKASSLSTRCTCKLAISKRTTLLPKQQTSPSFIAAAMDHALPTPEDDRGHYLSAIVAHTAFDLFLCSGTDAAVKIQGVTRCRRGVSNGWRIR